PPPNRGGTWGPRHMIGPERGGGGQQRLGRRRRLIERDERITPPDEPHQPDRRLPRTRDDSAQPLIDREQGPEAFLSQTRRVCDGKLPFRIDEVRTLDHAVSWAK